MKPIDTLRLYYRKHATMPSTLEAMRLFHVDSADRIAHQYATRARIGLLKRIRGGYTVTQELISIPLSQPVWVEGEVVV